jgi:hypothetical protein
MKMVYMWDNHYPDEPIPEPDELREEERYPDEPDDGFLTDAMADADALASAGYGTDEDYGGYGDSDDYSDSY